MCGNYKVRGLPFLTTNKKWYFSVILSVHSINKVEDNFLLYILFQRGVSINLSENVVSLYDELSYSLSTGEKTLLYLLSNLSFLNSYSIDERNVKNEKHLIIILDEPDIFLHPQMQKSLFNLLHITFSKIFKNKQIQIILTSHSPFLVSDLPKENIIFLAKGEKGECLVKNSLNDMKQTFGANIHTLLTDSFFMQDKGLMGKFAEGKINDVINWLNDGSNKNITELAEKQKSPKQEIEIVEWLIKQIGEPIIRNQLQKMLDSRRLAKVETHDKKITYLENIVSSLQEQIDKLKKQQ